jgi:hypothetical protein
MIFEAGEPRVVDVERSSRDEQPAQVLDDEERRVIRPGPGIGHWHPYNYGTAPRCCSWRKVSW